jgi:hypothetical protein
MMPHERSRASAGGLIRSPDGTCVIRYHVDQPAPNQWVAVGLVSTGVGDAAGAQWLVVETGATEAAAVSALRQRCPRSTAPSVHPGREETLR